MLIHRVPYFSQWESADLVPAFVAGTTPATADPRWAASGANDPIEYAYWAPRTCGIACLRMALAYWRPDQPVPPAVPLARECQDKGGYVPEGDKLHGLLYEPFATWIAERWGLHGQVHSNGLTGLQITKHLDTGGLAILSVHKTIRTPYVSPPQRGGHLVLAIGHDAGGLYIHNPSGLNYATQQANYVPWATLDRFFAQRGIELSPTYP